MKWLVWLAVVLSLLALLVVALPGPIASRRFSPGPLAAPYAPDRSLAEGCTRISSGEILHADKLHVDAAGRVLVGDETGRIHLLTPDGRGGYRRSVFAEPGGRPFEIDVDPQGQVVAADHEGPHVSIDGAGHVTRLATLVGLEHGTAGVAVGRDGTLYYGAHPEGLIAGDTSGFLEMLAAHQASELRAFDPETGTERVLATGLFRPVGVELSADEDFVAVAEFWAYRVTRHWLSGPRAGTTDRLVDRLPGFVDGLASDGHGTFYLSMPAYAPPLLAALHERPFLKDQLAKVLPTLLRLGAAPRVGPGIVVALDEGGSVLRTYQDPEGEVVSMLTAAEPHDGALFVGSITGDWIARCEVELAGAP